MATKSTPMSGARSTDYSSLFPAPMPFGIRPTAANGYGKAWQTYMNGLGKVSEEVLTFVTGRIEHDMKLNESLSQCKNWTDVAQLQQDWLRTACQDYADEARTLMTMTSKSMQDSLSSAFDGTDDEEQQQGSK